MIHRVVLRPTITAHARLRDVEVVAHQPRDVFVDEENRVCGEVAGS
jgi:hypothetical protein